MSGKCPKCEKLVQRARIDDISLSAGPGQTEWRGNAYVCPSCSTILGCEIDPIAIRTEIVSMILKGLGRSMKLWR